MKKIVAILFMLMVVFSANIYGITTSTNTTKVANSVQSINSISNVGNELQQKIDELLSFDALKNIDYGELFMNPFQIFGIMFKAIFIVVLINFAAKVICKYAFNMSSIIKSRRQSRKLNKVLKDLYD